MEINVVWENTQPWVRQLTRRQNTQPGYSVVLSFPAWAGRTGIFSPRQKIAWDLLHQRTKEWDAASQLITERQPGLLVSQSYTSENSHPTQPTPHTATSSRTVQVYTHFNYIFTQQREFTCFYFATEVFSNWWQRRVSRTFWSRLLRQRRGLLTPWSL